MDDRFSQEDDDLFMSMLSAFEASRNRKRKHATGEKAQ
jgi:hypothetical protein